MLLMITSHKPAGAIGNQLHFSQFSIRLRDFGGQRIDLPTIHSLVNECPSERMPKHRHPRMRVERDPPHQVPPRSSERGNEESLSSRGWAGRNRYDLATAPTR